MVLSCRSGDLVTAVRPTWALLAVLLLLETCALLSGCAEKPAENLSKDNDPVLRARSERNQAFKSDRRSPLREEDKARFQSLDYYDLDAKYRFQVILRRYPNPKTVRLVTNTGEQREALRYGYFEFEVEGQTCRLQVFRTFDVQENGTAALFIPFRDATSGKETYGGGRYIDLPENTSGTYDLDFNRAYNPSCAYGGAFSCPIPPKENTLPVSILAGEKKYALLAEAENTVPGK